MFSKHRLEALTDGIFAVAMTLLAIELKVPARADVHVAADVAREVARLLPMLIAWTISFVVLAIFWFSHNRLFHFVRAVDGPLTWLMLAYLGLVTLMPFSSALVGEYTPVLFSQVFYSANMMLLAIASLLISRYVARHPGLIGEPLPAGFSRSARIRTLGLATIALVAVGLATVVPGAGNVAFLLMIPVTAISRRVEHRRG